MTAPLPAYADAGRSFPSFRAPYAQRSANLAAFLFAAELPALSAWCDSALNVSDAFAYRYVPASSSVMLVYADMLVSSRDERDAQVGLIPESEIGFWVLTLAQRKTRRGYIPSHFAWALPYVFVNEGSALISGREVFGFNKQLARIEQPARLQKPEFSAETMGFKTFGAESVAQYETLLRARPFASSLDEQPAQFREAQSLFMDDLFRRARAGLDGTLTRLASRLLNDSIPLVFLKQFRDAADSSLACLQQLVEVRLTVERFRAGGMLLKPYLLNLPPLASHPLAQTLGLQENQGSKIGVWLQLDFLLHRAKIISAPR
ncbi:MAG: hypothetical protein Fur002_04550 [Anaerolineales bacterium]